MSHRSVDPISRSTPVLRVQSLSVRRGSVQILDGLDWTVNPGEHWVVLGANGSGKTSLLGVLNGYLTPTSGSVEVLGRVYGETDWRALRQRIGLVSSSLRQMIPDYEPALITVASGRYAMIDFWGTPRRDDRNQARRLLRQVECSHLEDRPWAYLSQGERQRVLIGRALAASPEILILDEPCAGLDPVARESFLSFVERLGLKRGGPRILFVTHHVEEITPVFNRVLILAEGRVVCSGPLRENLNSAALTKSLGAPVKVTCQRGAYHLKVLATPRRR